MVLCEGVGEEVDGLDVWEVGCGKEDFEIDYWGCGEGLGWVIWGDLIVCVLGFFDNGRYFIWFWFYDDL